MPYAPERELADRRHRTHGGSIEQYTSDIARGMAGEDFNLYLFEAIQPAGNYSALHLTSHRFDEPRCLSLLSMCDHVVAIHGCDGSDQRVLLGDKCHVGSETTRVVPHHDFA